MDAIYFRNDFLLLDISIQLRGAMTPDEFVETTKVLEKLISQYPSMREFARTIREDITDVSRWKCGKKRLTTRAIVSICCLHPEVKPFQLNPDNFPRELEFVFKKGKKE